MDTIQILNFQHNIVRTVSDEKGELWFLANDVCDILGYANPRRTIDLHCKLKGVTKRYTPTESGKQEMTYINEPNLYRLIIKSRKPAAEAFEEWVMEDVLPTIRKSGEYSLSGSLKTKTALPNGLTLEQQDVVKAMHREILEQTPPEMRKALAIKLWASIKQKFGCTYKAVSPDCFNEVISLMGRIAVENGIETLHGEVLDKQPETAAITFSQSELRELATITYYCAWSNNLLRELAEPLTALGYERASTVRTLPMESRGFIRRIHRALTREMPKINSAFERDDMQNSLNRCGLFI